MIIAISAAPIFDKTIRSEYLSREYSLEVLRDPARDVCNAWGFQTIYDMPDGLQKRVRESLIADHLEFISSTDDVLLEYSVFEWLADWMRWFWGKTPVQLWERVIDLATRAVMRYDCIYHIDTGPHKAYDGYTWLDKANSKQIDVLIKHLYHQFAVGKKLSRDK